MFSKSQILQQAFSKSYGLQNATNSNSILLHKGRIAKEQCKCFGIHLADFRSLLTSKTAKLQSSLCTPTPILHVLRQRPKGRGHGMSCKQTEPQSSDTHFFSPQCFHVKERAFLKGFLNHHCGSLFASPLCCGFCPVTPLRLGSLLLSLGHKVGSWLNLCILLHIQQCVPTRLECLTPRLRS